MIGWFVHVLCPVVLLRNPQMSDSIEENLQTVMGMLAAVDRDDSGYGWAVGDAIAERTGLAPGDINDAVTLLVESGAAKWLQALESHTWRFTLVALTPRGRALLQKAKS